MKCPKCGSENISIEKRIDGNCTCLNCGFIWKNWQTIYKVKPKLSTAEKLLKLQQTIHFVSDFKIIYFAEGYKTKVFKGNIENQINEAYEHFAKEQK